MNILNGLKKLMSRITVNNKHYDIDENSTVIVNGGKVIINGIDCTPDLKNINISVSGNIKNLQIGACNKLDVVGDVTKLDCTSGDITVTGSAGSVSTTSGDVKINLGVEGKVETMSGDVTAETIKGGVQTMSGDIKAKTMSGNISL